MALGLDQLKAGSMEVLDSRFRGNDGIGGGNDGLGVVLRQAQDERGGLSFDRLRMSGGLHSRENRMCLGI